MSLAGELVGAHFDNFEEKNKTNTPPANQADRFWNTELKTTTNQQINYGQCAAVIIINILPIID